MAKDTSSRDYLFDNYKAILIVLVIMGHFTDLNYKNNAFLETVKWLIVAFHMPAFIYISGYFSKKEASLRKLIQTLLVPYLVYECIYYLLYTLVLQRPTKLYLMYPKFSLWYILALFIWRIITPYVRKIPGHMILAIAAGLLIGLSDMKDNFLTIPRMLVYYPYFLAGFHMDRSFFTRVRTRLWKILSAAGIGAFTLYLLMDSFHKQSTPKIFYGRYNYEYLGQTPLEGICVRLLSYGIGFALTFMIASLVSERKTWYSYLGKYTMSIYILHGLVYSCFKYGSDILATIHTVPQTIALLVFCVLLAFLGAARPFVWVCGKISSVPLAPPSFFTGAWNFHKSESQLFLPTRKKI